MEDQLKAELSALKSKVSDFTSTLESFLKNKTNGAFETCLKTIIESEKFQDMKEAAK